MLAGVNAHSHACALDSFGGIIGLVLPPFIDLLQVLLQNVLLGLGQLQVFQPFLVLGISVMRVGCRRAMNSRIPEKSAETKGQRLWKLQVVLEVHVQSVSWLV